MKKTILNETFLGLICSYLVRMLGSIMWDGRRLQTRVCPACPLSVPANPLQSCWLNCGKWLKERSNSFAKGEVTNIFQTFDIILFCLKARRQYINQNDISCLVAASCFYANSDSKFIVVLFDLHCASYNHIWVAQHNASHHRQLGAQNLLRKKIKHKFIRKLFLQSFRCF